MTEPVWIAATAVTAPLIKHIQDPNWYAPLCGEKRREWKWVEDFERPEAFTPCERCKELAA